MDRYILYDKLLTNMTGHNEGSVVKTNVLKQSLAQGAYNKTSTPQNYSWPATPKLQSYIFICFIPPAVETILWDSSFVG